MQISDYTSLAAYEDAIVCSIEQKTRLVEHLLGGFSVNGDDRYQATRLNQEIRGLRQKIKELHFIGPVPTHTISMLNVWYQGELRRSKETAAMKERVWGAVAKMDQFLDKTKGL